MAFVYLVCLSLIYALVFDELVFLAACEIIVGPLGFLLRVPADEPAFAVCAIVVVPLAPFVFARLQGRFAWHAAIHCWCLLGFVALWVRLFADLR